MDTRGARHLSARLAIGAAVGERVEIVAVAPGYRLVRPGDAGRLLSIDEEGARVLLESGIEVVLDPVYVRGRRAA